MAVKLREIIEVSERNPNHPKKGSSIKVEPIRTKAAIERIKASLLHGEKYRDHCLFTLDQVRPRNFFSVKVADDFC